MLPDSPLGVDPILVWDGVIVHHVQAIPGKLVVEELVSQVELDSEEEEVKKLTLAAAE